MWKVYVVKKGTPQKIYITKFSLPNKIAFFLIYLIKFCLVISPDI